MSPPQIPSHKFPEHNSDLVIRKYEMFDTVRSAESTSSETPGFNRRRMMRSIADELDGDFEDISLDPADSLDQTENPKESREKVTEDTKNIGNMVPEEPEQPTATECEFNSLEIADGDSDSPTTLADDDKRSPTAETFSNTARARPLRKSNFVEHVSPVNSSPLPTSHKDHVKTMASIHNRELIGRNADGFFNMETVPTSTDSQRRVQQSMGIVALQKTLVPATERASSNTSSSHALSSTAVGSVNCPSRPKPVKFAESTSRRPHGVQGPYAYTVSRPKPASGFSLARDLIAAGHRKRLAEPSAPARFVKMPTDPTVNFKRNIGDFGLKLQIPDPEPVENETGEPDSMPSVPDVDSAAGFVFGAREPGSNKHAVPDGQTIEPKLEFGIPRAFIPDQCFESSCPIRFAHAKGPYLHLGQRPNRIMTGLFGRSNPPPEIWNAYRNMLQITCDGEIISPDGRPGSNADAELVIAFAMFHYGGLNDMSGEQFHRRYAGQHMSSRIAFRSSNTNSSTGSCGSCVRSWI